MVINLSDEAAALLFVMVVRPYANWQKEHWLKSESPARESKVGALHRWCEKNLISEEDVNGQKPLKGGKRLMPNGMVELAQEHLEHYKKQPVISGQGARPSTITDVYYADLRAALDGKPLPSADDGIDPKEREEFEKACTQAE